MGPFGTIRLYTNGSLYDHNGGSTYTPPPPVPGGTLLLEDGFGILLENGNYIALEKT